MGKEFKNNKRKLGGKKSKVLFFSDSYKGKKGV